MNIIWNVQGDRGGPGFPGFKGEPGIAIRAPKVSFIHVLSVFFPVCERSESRFNAS